MLPDINVLVAAHRSDHPQHKSAADWLKRTLKDTKDGQVLILPMQVISGFLRLVRLLGQTSEWASFRALLLDKQLSANHVPDAHLAALSISLSEPFVTFDKGFRQLLPRSLLVLLPTA
jgi:uncharacterized protein